jgi:hypothetical protein
MKFSSDVVQIDSGAKLPLLLAKRLKTLTDIPL